MKKQPLFEYRLFSAIFDTQQSKYDVIAVSDVILDLTFTALERFCAPSLVVFKQQIKEKQRGDTMCPILHGSKIPQPE